jgi:hypothetical protein
MSSKQGFVKATSAWRDPLKTIKGKRCRICGEPATCAILTLNVGAACESHAKRAKELGYEVIFPSDGTLIIKKA